MLGTGLATVALGLLAFDLAGDEASLVLGTIFTIKMVAYVGLSPIAGALAELVPRRALLVGLDGLRFGGPDGPHHVFDVGSGRPSRGLSSASVVIKASSGS